MEDREIAIYESPRRPRGVLRRAIRPNIAISAQIHVSTLWMMP